MEPDGIKRDIEICMKCKFFHEENDPVIEGQKGWHWGVGCRCSRVAFGVPWSKDSAHAVSEDEFVKAEIHFAGNCYMSNHINPQKQK